MGISVDQFSEVIQRSKHADLNEFVLASILTVDDFLQFKSMMVRRNVDLTNEVLEANGRPQITVEQYKVDCKFTTPERCAPSPSGA